MGSLVSHEEPAVVVPSKPTVVKVPAKDEVTYLKEGDDVVKKITTYMVNASTGALTPTEKKGNLQTKMVPKLRLLLRHYSQVFVMKKTLRELRAEKM